MFFVHVLIILFAVAIMWFIFQGAPSFVSTHKKAVETIADLAGDVAGKKVADLGSGDGRIVIALAKKGAEAHGFEINPLLVWQSRLAIKKAGLSGRALIHWQSYWKEDLSPFSVVVVFGISHIMEKLKQKLLKELSPGSIVISYVFPFPNWNFTRHEENGVYLYKV